MINTRTTVFKNSTLINVCAHDGNIFDGKILHNDIA